MKIRKTAQRFSERVFGQASQHYGHDQILRAWTGYPAILPLNVQIQHGWYHDFVPELTGGKKGIQVMLVWSERTRDMWREGSSAPVHIVGAPFVHYRRMNGIERTPGAKGTVVFPNHSTPNGIEEYDVDAYCADLERLPDKLKPITICLHYRDMEEKAPQFRRHGFDVVTAGHGRQVDFGFVRRFYDILSRHKYCCSNEIGSYTFYAVEMGIPFFITGPESRTINRHDETIEEKKGPYRVAMRELFRNTEYRITDQQREYVFGEVGVGSHVSPTTLRKVFFRQLFFREIWAYPIRMLKTIGEGLRRF